MTQSFYSNGKLLLTSEYLVMDGATALAIPTKYGQSLTVKTSKSPGIQWKSLDYQGKVWFAYDFPSIGQLKVVPTDPIAIKLLEILKTATELNPQFLVNSAGVEVSTKLDFPRDWGLGTSSTLINNIAQWAAVDAYELLHKSFGGSGYDIAAAKNDGPILYRIEHDKPHVEPIHLHWNFTDSLFFVHLNKKQDSKDGIQRYRDRNRKDASAIKTFHQLSMRFVQASSLAYFEDAIRQHELLISQCIGIAPIQQRLFPEFTGTIKSLGAWGGDFVLATGTMNQMDYFKRKGYATIIPFKDMIK